jgi:diacylglycerol kinase
MKKLFNFGRSIINAWRGLIFIFKSQRNFRLQTIAGLLVLLIAWFLHVRRQEWLILLLLTTMVLVLEVLNTVFESFLDMIQPKIHGYVKVFKDMLAAMVLLASVAAAVIGIVIFYPYL